MKQLEKEFDAAMMDIYIRAKSEANYSATLFHQMLISKGGLTTARQLVNDGKISSGYTTLWELGRLDLTVEALIFDNAKWHGLFTRDEYQKIKKRLTDYNYFKN